ncbi:MAG: hypothetical protein KGI38_12465 [Thaumarchaeota archaeon]|nr:hypothetical protein [Nitrososphaerota archaeon]
MSAKGKAESEGAKDEAIEFLELLGQTLEGYVFWRDYVPKLEEAIKALESSSPPEALRRLREEAIERCEQLDLKAHSRDPIWGLDFTEAKLRKKELVEWLLPLIDAELGKAAEEAGR